MRKKQTRVGIDLLRKLVENGLSIFTTAQARTYALQLGITESYVIELLHHLRNAQWIRSIKRGTYAITEESGFENPPHDYAIAMALVSPCAISHWTALYHHHLTQQIPQTIFALTPTGTYIPRPALKDTIYRFVQIKPEYFFGISKEWVGNSRVSITDPERTLLDGLLAPQCCGGIHEVLGAFEMRQRNLDLEKIVDYACRLDQAIIARLGWVLEKLGFSDGALSQLLTLRPKGVRNLDASGPDRGPINNRWQIRQNFGVVEK